MRDRATTTTTTDPLADWIARLRRDNPRPYPSKKV
jgi:hypothetical protein